MNEAVRTLLHKKVDAEIGVKNNKGQSKQALYLWHIAFWKLFFSLFFFFCTEENIFLAKGSLYEEDESVIIHIQSSLNFDWMFYFLIDISDKVIIGCVEVKTRSIG